VLERLPCLIWKRMGPKGRERARAGLPLEPALPRENCLEDGRWRRACLCFNLIEQVVAWKVDVKLDGKRRCRPRLMRRARPQYEQRGAMRIIHLISALHKSVRGSDPDAALLLAGGVNAGRWRDPRI